MRNALALLVLVDFMAGLVIWQVCCAINARQRFILPGVGILKLIYHGHWKLRANDLRQSTVWCMQCRMQSLQQIRKIKAGQTSFLQQIRTPHFECGMVSAN
jgi:hypothetical protein